MQWTAAVLVSLVLALGGWTVSQLIRIHPYHDAFLNQFVNAALPANTEEVFELEYWGHAYKEGAQWLAGNVPADAVINVPISPHVAWTYLREHFRRVRPGDRYEAERPRFEMFITRRARYDARIRALERTHRPIHTIERQNATLLKIYHLGG